MSTTIGFGLTQQEKITIRWQTLVAMLERTDRILSGTRITVETFGKERGNSKEASGIDSNNFAWSLPLTTPPKIFLSQKSLPPPTTYSNIAVTTAANYHELCHVMYVSRELTEAVNNHNISSQLIYYYNLLEDARIERLFVQRYPVARSYFTAMIGNLLIDNVGTDKDSLNNLYLLLYGRKYLDPSIVRAAGNTCTLDSKILVAAEAIINEYIVLPDFNLIKKSSAGIIRNRALDLILKLRKLFQTDADTINGQPSSHVSKNCITHIEDNRVNYSNAPNNKTEKLGDITPENNGNANTDRSKAIGALTAILKAAAGQEVNNGEASQEIKSTAKELNVGQFNHAGDQTGEKIGYKPAGVSAPYMSAVRQLDKALSEIQADKDPGWEHFTDSGRINPLRFAQTDDPDTAFDTWEEGKTEDTEIEAVLLIDRSGSMSSRTSSGISKYTHAMQTAWAFKRSIDSVGGSATVIAFDTSVHVVYKAEDKAGANKYRNGTSGGGTSPYDALVISHKILASSTLKNKLLIIVTDGAWCSCHSEYKVSDAYSYSTNHCSADRSNKMCERISLGATTTLLLLADNNVIAQGREPDPHGCESALIINGAQDLFKSTQKIVRMVAKRGGKK